MRTPTKAPTLDLLQFVEHAAASESLDCLIPRYAALEGAEVGSSTNASVLNRTWGGMELG